MGIVPPAIERFCSIIEQRLGLDAHTHGVGELERVLAERSVATGLTSEAYLQRLEGDARAGEWQHLVNKLTIGETYFFRHVEQLDACRSLLQRVGKKLAGRRPLRVLCAGCSTGEEPYSLAMLLHEHGAFNQPVEIVGMDVNPVALERARAGRYAEWSLRETPVAMRERWFVRERKAMRLNPTITAAVTFVHANLTDPGFSLLGEFDLILCRNVLMYFTAERFRQTAARLLNMLRPEGALFLGHAESLRDLSLEAQPVHDFGVFFYRPLAATKQGTLRAAPSDGPCDEPPRHAVRPHTTREGQELPTIFESGGGHIEELVRQERYSEALNALDALGANASAFKSTIRRLHLQRAMLLVYSNEFDAARALLDSLSDDLSLAAEVHYALALCHEASGQLHEAMYHNRFAAHLDPTFAMPWLHLGLLNKRLGDDRAARRELLQARALVIAETPERVLWFGGGCSRARLLDACHGGLEAWGQTR